MIDEAVGPAVRPIVKQTLDQIMPSLDRRSDAYQEMIFEGRGRHVDPLPKGHAFARIVRAYMAAEGNAERAVGIAQNMGFGDPVVKALESGSATGGGLLIAGETAQEIIELLRPRSIVRRAGPREINIPAGTLNFPRIDSGSSAAYVGESEEIALSHLQTGAVNLIARKLAALTTLSNELLRYQTSVDVDAIVLDDLLGAIAETEDTKLLFGTGAEAEPLGIVEQIPAGNKFDANATVNVANTVADLTTVRTTLANTNTPLLRPAWLWNPRTTLYLQSLLNADGQFVFREEIDRGRLFNWPFFESNNIPANLGGGSDESLIVAIDMSEVMLGQVSAVEIARSSEASIKVGAELQSLFQRDQSAIRTILRNDVQMRHRTSGAVIEKVTWGA